MGEEQTYISIYINKRVRGGAASHLLRDMGDRYTMCMRIHACVRNSGRGGSGRDGTEAKWTSASFFLMLYCASEIPSSSSSLSLDLFWLGAIY